jgi:outer membrane autotransporter protein
MTPRKCNGAGMGKSRSFILALLATSSSLTLMAAGSGPAYAACAAGTTSGFNNPANTTINCILFNNLAVTGNTVNAGTIMPGGPTGISVQGGRYTGSILNSGVIRPNGTALNNGSGIAVVNVTTFTGGITSTGTISGVAAGGRGIDVDFVTMFSGGISVAGVVSAPGQSGIEVHRSGTFTGGITNSGNITSKDTGIDVFMVTSFSGGISNSGTVSSTFETAAISVSKVTSFTGGITNSGTLSSPFVGIFVGTMANFAPGGSAGGGIVNTGRISTAGTTGGIVVSFVSSFSGGITNSGSLSAGAAPGITVNPVSTFTGGISNSGTISARTGIVVGALGNPVSVFSGGVSNSGMISANVTGIDVHLISTFSGGISNSGTISAVQSGIQVLQISTFAGGISNRGTIVSQGSQAISVATVSNFSGGISNSGTVSAAGSRAINIFHISTFAGGITNSGTLSGATGILVAGGSPITGAVFSGSIANSGTITGTVAAIDVSLAPAATTINQMAGTITGAIKLSPFADALNISGGTINGNVVGQGVSNTVNFALGGGTFTYGSPFSITGVNQLNVNSGLVILDGTNSVTNVAINNGTLEVGDASNPGAMLTATNGVNIAAGGTLAGHGTLVGNIAIPSGATLAPGGSIGTLNVTGNLSLAAGSFYQVAVTAAGQNSKTVATGTATIAGGTVEVMEQPGTYPPTSKYTILTANAGVNGTFTNAASDFAFLTPVLSYDADDVFLTLSRNPTFFQSLAQTANQRSVAAALDASPLASPIVAPVLFQTAAGARQAFDAFSGEVHGSVQSVLIDDSHYMRQAMLGRLRQAAFAHAPDAMAALGFDGPVTAAEEPAESPALGYGPASAFPVKAPRPAAYGSDVTFWSQGVGAWGQFGSDGNAAAVRSDLAGLFSGVDARFGEFGRIGLAGGYTHSSLSIDAQPSSAGIDTAHLGAYAGANVGAFNLRGGAAYAFHTIDTSRTIVFPGFLDNASARYNGGTGQVFGEVGYGVTLGRIAAEPFVGLTWVHLRTDGFAETGGVAALNGSSSTEDVGYSTLGGRLATSYPLANGMALIPRISASWQHAFNDIAPTAALAFQNTGAGFSITGVPLARDAALVETALDLRLSPQAKLGLSYSGQLAGQLQDHALKGNFTWNF